MDGLVEGLIPLQDITKNEGERIAESALLSETGIRVRNSYLRHCQLMFIDS